MENLRDSGPGTGLKIRKSGTGTGTQNSKIRDWNRDPDLWDAEFRDSNIRDCPGNWKFSGTRSRSRGLKIFRDTVPVPCRPLGWNFWEYNQIPCYQSIYWWDYSCDLVICSIGLGVSLPYGTLFLSCMQIERWIAWKISSVNRGQWLTVNHFGVHR